jgi:hypothetical protein
MNRTSWLSSLLAIALGLGLGFAQSATALVTVGAFDTEEARGFDRVGDLVFLAESVDGVRILDVSDRTAPFEIGHFDTRDALDVDVSPPSTPEVLGSIDTW